MIAGLVLAAGRSTRFGGDKLLAPLGGRPVIRWTAEAIAGAVDRMYVVAPPSPAALVDALHGLSYVVVEHTGRDEGMGSSIRAGIASLDADVQAIVIALGDQPLVASSVVRQLGAAWRSCRGRAVVPVYHDGEGHPVLFGRDCFAALVARRGDGGARPVLEALGDDVCRLTVAGMMPRGADTPDALADIALTLLRLP